ncbi:MAG: HNH endonuclease [Actinomycetota bacterium]
MSGADAQIREAAWRHVELLKQLFGTIPPRELRKGFEFKGEQVHLVGQTGIFRPRQMSSLLSLASTRGSIYSDAWIDETTMAYAYHDGSKQYTNDWMREAMVAQHPVIYFEQLPDGTYDAELVFIVDDRPTQRQVLLRSTPSISAATAEESIPYGAEERPAAYGHSLTKRRRHQAWFAAEVMAAYESKCAICRLQRRPLLDAAHILPDGETPTVSASMGIAMCKIHHAAFDFDLLGIEPGSHRVTLKEEVLQEVDGPMLRHGLQEMHGTVMVLPKSADKHPDPAALELRWDRFRAS